jgi:hypothetical protein
MYLFDHRWWAHTRVAPWPCRSWAGAVLPTGEYGSKRIHRAAQPGPFASGEFFNSLLCLHSFVGANDFGLVFGHLCRPCRMGSSIGYSEPNRSHRCKTEGPACCLHLGFCFWVLPPRITIAPNPSRSATRMTVRERGGILGKGVRASGTA